MAPRAGFEPATIRLTVECSTAELPRNRRRKCSRAAAYNKADPACIEEIRAFAIAWHHREAAGFTAVWRPVFRCSGGGMTRSVNDRLSRAADVAFYWALFQT